MLVLVMLRSSNCHMEPDQWSILPLY